MNILIFSSIILSIFYLLFFVFFSTCTSRVLANKYKLFANQIYLQKFSGILFFLACHLIFFALFVVFTIKVSTLFYLYLVFNGGYIFWIFYNRKWWAYKSFFNKPFLVILSFTLLFFIIYCLTFGQYDRNDDASFYQPWILYNLIDNNYFNAINTSTYHKISVKNWIYAFETYYPYISFNIKLFSYNNPQLIDPNFFSFYAMNFIFIYTFVTAGFAIRNLMFKQINKYIFVSLLLAFFMYFILARNGSYKGVDWTLFSYPVLVFWCIYLFKNNLWNKSYALLIAFIQFSLYFINSSSIFISLFMNVALAFVFLFYNQNLIWSYFGKIFGFFSVLNMSLFLLLLIIFHQNPLALDALIVLIFFYFLSLFLFIFNLFFSSHLKYLNKFLSFIKKHFLKFLLITYGISVLLSVILMFAHEKSFSLNIYFQAFSPINVFISRFDISHPSAVVIGSWIFIYSVYALEIVFPIAVFLFEYKRYLYKNIKTERFYWSLYSLIITLFFFNFLNSYLISFYSTTNIVYGRTNRLVAPLLIFYFLNKMLDFKPILIIQKTKYIFHVLPSAFFTGFLTANSVMLNGHSLFYNPSLPPTDWFTRSYQGEQDIVNEIALQYPNQEITLVGDVENFYLFNYNVAPAYPRFVDSNSDDYLYQLWTNKKMDFSNMFDENIQKALNVAYFSNVDFIIKYVKNISNDSKDVDLIVYKDTTAVGKYVYLKNLSENYGKGYFAVYLKN